MNTKQLQEVGKTLLMGRSAELSTEGIAPSTGGELPLSHRLSIVYLALPMVVWLVGWLEWWAGLPMAGLLAAGLWRCLSGSWRVSLSLPLLASLLAALGWVLATSVGGLWGLSHDLKFNHAVLLDMGRGGWPTYMTDYLHGDPPLLAYYLGWHMVPGLVGRWLGPAALGWAVPVWTWIGVGLMAAVLTRGLTTVRAALLAVAVLVFFSGADAFEYVLRLGPLDAAETMLDRLRHNMQLEWPDSTVTKHLEYQSNTATLWHSPHHFIPGGLSALVIVGSRRRPELAAVSGLLVVICLFWSAFSAAGLLALVAAMAVTQGVRPFLRWPNLVAAPALGALMGLYLSSNDTEPNWGWLRRHYDSAAQMLADLAPLYAAEIALVALALWLTDRRLAKEPTFIASVAVLVAAPWITYRFYLNHDVMLRLSVPALIVLTYYAARAVLSRLPEPAADAFSPPPPRPRRWWYAALVAVLCVGAATPALALLTSTNRDFNPYGATHKTLMTDNLAPHVPNLIPERTASAVSGLLQTVLRDHDEKGLPTGEPIISSKYDVYLQEQTNALRYLNRNCDPDLERTIGFFLHIHYKDRQSRWQVWSHRQDGSDCANSLGVPDYDIGRIVIGQYIPFVGVLWATEYRFDDPDPVTDLHPYYPDAHQHYSFYYQIAADEKPLISSVFNVHLARLHEPTLIYTKEPCTRQDIRTPFFLHITPEDPDDLPEGRRQSGFDNHDFHFNDLDTTHGNKCLALIPIPDYPIASIRTGQFNPDTDLTLWRQQTIIDR